jgi:predicted HAD superfamily Cof-like phosphohydrolase
MSEFKDVEKFHNKFGIMSAELPRHITHRKLKERLEFLFEELFEFASGCGFVVSVNGNPIGMKGSEHITPIEFMEMDQQDMPEMADALIDLVYVAKGTAVMMGLPWKELWDDVQRANMAKVRGVGKRGHAVDCVKPEGWEPPQTLKILEGWGYVEEHDNDPDNHADDLEVLEARIRDLEGPSKPTLTIVEKKNEDKKS